MPGVLKISAAARLAIHALTRMMASHGGGPMTATEIALELGVSADHLSKVLLQLAREGMLVSRRGPGGGFILAQSTPERSLLEVVELFDGAPTASPCILKVRGCEGEDCFLSGLEQDAARRMVSGLEGMQVRELVRCESDEGQAVDS